MASVLRILGTRCVFKAGQLTVFCNVLQEANRAKIRKKGKNGREVQWRLSNIRLLFRGPL